MPPDCRARSQLAAGLIVAWLFPGDICAQAANQSGKRSVRLHFPSAFYCAFGEMAAAHTEILRLYRHSLKAAQQFETYNFRKYFYRRTRDRFRSASALSDPQAIDKALEEARAELVVAKRQGALNRMFAHNRTVIESDPQYASGTRRFAE
ncbi:hypothetical protein GQ54DRAFT_306233 [Martensiomyces pterosporus]|nr:hypothetical protein GQ54DRAFT_306233 [Martensiomyces pterosporus]